MSNPVPAISVIMSVYNGAEHLAETMDSILAQTFTEFEFLIVDDASTDNTPAILAEYAAHDSRVRILTNPVNQERSASRNRAMNEAHAPLIAIMDADDWAHPERLAKQYEFMQENPDVTVCGTWLQTYETGAVWRWPAPNTIIRSCMLFNAYIAHPTVMFRKNAVLELCQGYNETLSTAEDYDLWSRLAEHDSAVFANLPEILLRYRTYPEKDRSHYHATMLEHANRIRRHQLLRYLELKPSDAEMEYHLVLARAKAPPSTVRELMACRRWAQTLLDANARTKFCDPNMLEDFLQIERRKLLRRAMRAKLAALWPF